jgi:hypothetical protein
MILAKKHISNGKIVLALCDKEIYGKRYEKGKRVLDLSSGFYSGTEKTEKEISEMIKRSYIVNAAGDLSVGLLIKNNIISKDECALVGGIKHIQVFIGREI